MNTHKLSRRGLRRNPLDTARRHHRRTRPEPLVPASGEIVAKGDSAFIILPVIGGPPAVYRLGSAMEWRITEATATEIGRLNGKASPVAAPHPALKEAIDVVLAALIKAENAQTAVR